MDLNDRVGQLERGLKVALSRIWVAGSDLVHGTRKGFRSLRSRTAALFGINRNSAPVRVANFTATVPGGRRIYAVGDVHGRADLLVRLIAEITADASRGSFTGRPILVFLGDYIDRGFQSREVIDVLLGESMSPFETYFLKGNHEAAMLQFLDDPQIGPRWASFGGIETLVSYGVRPPVNRASSEAWAQASADLKAALPSAHLRFLANLDLSVRIGDYVFVHAGVRPGVPLEKQTEQDMLWIRDAFLADRRPLGVVVVHGHTPAVLPYRDGRRVGLDTGAYLSGRLTAARFEHDSVEFLTTGLRTDAPPAVTPSLETAR